MAAERERFIERATAQGVTAKDAGKVFDLMEFFAGYGFNKSHSRGVRARRLSHGVAEGALSRPFHGRAPDDGKGEHRQARAVRERVQARWGSRCLPPDVNTSGLDFTVEGDRRPIRIVRDQERRGRRRSASLLEARGALDRPFRSMFELASEIDLRLVNKRVFEALVASGALDSIGARRSQLAAAVDAALEWGQKRRSRSRVRAGEPLRRRCRAGRGSGRAVGGPSRPPRLGRAHAARARESDARVLRQWPPSGELCATSSPISPPTARPPCASARREAKRRSAGSSTDLRKRKSKKGLWWASFQLEDLEGQVEVLVFPKAFEQFQALLENDRAVLVTGRVESEEGRVRLSADEVASLDDLRERKAEAVQIRLEAAELDDDADRPPPPGGRGAPRRRVRLPGDRAPGGFPPGRPGRADAPGPAVPPAFGRLGERFGTGASPVPGAGPALSWAGLLRFSFRMF